MLIVRLLQKIGKEIMKRCEKHINVDRVFSGFIISTILIRMSFTVEGFINNILIIASIVFGLGILWVHNKFVKNLNFN